MPAQTITLGFGRVNFSTTMVAYAAMKVTAPWVRVSAVSSGQNINRGFGSNSWLTYSPGVHAEVNGTLYSANASHEDGTIILLSSSWKARGVPTRDGAILVRVRSTGPSIVVRAKVPLERENRIGEVFKVFEGRADILSPQEAEDYGLSVPDSFAYKFMDPTEVDECYDIQLVDDELLPSPTVKVVKTAKGVEKVVEVAQVPARRMTFKKRK